MTLKTVSSCLAATLFVAGSVQMAAAQAIDCTLPANAEEAQCLDLPAGNTTTPVTNVVPLVAPLAAAGLLAAGGGSGTDGTTSTTATTSTVSTN